MDQHAGQRERLSRIQTALADNGLSAVVCSHNLNVLLLSGYWPVIGSAVAIATIEPRVILFVPEDAEQLASGGWADRIYPFKSASLTSLRNSSCGLLEVFKKVLPSLFPGTARIGCEAGMACLPASYVSQQVYGDVLPALLNAAAPSAIQVSADDLLMDLRARPTAWEQDRIRTACTIAAKSFIDGAPMLKVGVTETESVLPFQKALCIESNAWPDVARSGGFFYCMSGINASHAYAAFQRSQRKTLRPGEPVLIHCNSYADGYWTDLTRTYALDAPDKRLSHMFNAVSAARAAALNTIRPGVLTSEVDNAARAALSDAGYGAAFMHPTGHGVGFGAIDHQAKPRLHPCSTEILEEGMVFNVEPGIYIAGYGGVRDCNMVAVTDHGYELLSPFHLAEDEWCIGQ